MLKKNIYNVTLFVINNIMAAVSTEVREVTSKRNVKKKKIKIEEKPLGSSSA